MSELLKTSAPRPNISSNMDMITNHHPKRKRHLTQFIQGSLYINLFLTWFVAFYLHFIEQQWVTSQCSIYTTLYIQLLFYPLNVTFQIITDCWFSFFSNYCSIPAILSVIPVPIWYCFGTIKQIYQKLPQPAFPITRLSSIFSPFSLSVIMTLTS